MTPKKKIEKTDGYLILRDGDKEFVYLDRRAGLSWPSAHHPGYFAIYGQMDNYDPVSQKFPLVLLLEQSVPDTKKFFHDFLINANRYGVTRAYLNMSDKNQLNSMALSRFIRENPEIDCRYPFIDASSFADFEKAYPITEELLRTRTLAIGNQSLVRQELVPFQKDDFRRKDNLSPVDTRPAMEALSYVAAGFEFYPSVIAASRIRRARAGMAGIREGYR